MAYEPLSPVEMGFPTSSSESSKISSTLLDGGCGIAVGVTLLSTPLLAAALHLASANAWSLALRWSVVDGTAMLSISVILAAGIRVRAPRDCIVDGSGAEEGGSGTTSSRSWKK